MMIKCSYTNKKVEYDRRLRFERRQFSYSDIIPERRSGKDRRNNNGSFGFKFHPNIKSVELKRGVFGRYTT
jgi:hypothetical protein